MDRRTAGVGPQRRLAEAVGSTPDIWLWLQMAYDFARAMKREAEIKRDERPVALAG